MEQQFVNLMALVSCSFCCLSYFACSFVVSGWRKVFCRGVSIILLLLAIGYVVIVAGIAPPNIIPSYMRLLAISLFFLISIPCIYKLALWHFRRGG